MLIIIVILTFCVIIHCVFLMIRIHLRLNVFLWYASLNKEILQNVSLFYFMILLNLQTAIIAEFMAVYILFLETCQKMDLILKHVHHIHNYKSATAFLAQLSTACSWRALLSTLSCVVYHVSAIIDSKDIRFPSEITGPISIKLQRNIS